jgi:hypothetical protein
MFHFAATSTSALPISSLVSTPMAVLIAAAFVMSLPIRAKAAAAWPKLSDRAAAAAVGGVTRVLFLVAATVLSLASMTLAQQNPFIYFRF